MQSANQNTSEYNTNYDPNVALEFFRLFGKSESAKLGEIIFEQGQKANRFLLQNDKMYLLVKGKVDIQTGSEIIASVKAGEIFGELSPLILSPRSASAIADVPCRFITLTENQLIAGLKKKPEFALMLMNILVKYLRQAVIKKKKYSSSSAETDGANSKKSTVFDAKILRELARRLGEDAIMNVPKQRVIFQEGGSGMLMYVILEGYVTASIANEVVERTGPGGVIGEIALIDQKRRIAKVVAETNCSLLSLDRQTFLDLVKTQPSFSLSLLRALALRLYLCRTGRSYIPSDALFSGF